jgi:hypothetical protein
VLSAFGAAPFHRSILHVTLAHNLVLISKGASGFHLLGVFTPLDFKYFDARTCEIALFRSTIGLALNLTATIASSKTPVASRSMLKPLIHETVNTWIWCHMSL